MNVPKHLKITKKIYLPYLFLNILKDRKQSNKENKLQIWFIHNLRLWKKINRLNRSSKTYSWKLIDNLKLKHSGFKNIQKSPSMASNLPNNFEQLIEDFMHIQKRIASIAISIHKDKPSKNLIFPHGKISKNRLQLQTLTISKIDFISIIIVNS